MSIESNKLMNLADGKVLYDDLRDRTEDLRSALTGKVGFTDYASSNTAGVVKTSQSIGINSSGAIGIIPATTTDLKELTNGNQAITPSRLANGVFFGLSKAAGVDLKDETVTTGTYPTTSKTAINTMLGSVSKDSLDNAGITAKTYTTKFGGEFSVTTATTTGYTNPYARAPVTGRFSKDILHSVTVNGTEYVLPAKIWYNHVGQQSAHGHNATLYEYIGNLGLYIENISDVPGDVSNVPFVIVSNLNMNDSIDVITETSGTYTILVKEITQTQTQLPLSLMYGNSYYPVNIKKDTSYDSVSIGLNELKNQKRSMAAIGLGNSVEEDNSIAVGFLNKVTGTLSVAVGRDNTVSGDYACATGNETIVSGNSAHAEGEETHAEGRASHSEGQTTTASGNFSHAEGQNTTASLDAAHSEGLNTVASGAYSHAEGNTASASGNTSHAEGYKTTAYGPYSHAEGRQTTSVGNSTHAEGLKTYANGGYSHAEGYQSRTSNYGTHAEGNSTVADGSWSHVDGKFNIPDSYDNWLEWTANTSYTVGDKVKVTTTSNNTTTVTGYVCKTANSDSSFTSSNWTNLNYEMNYAVITGNGSADNTRSNAYALDWNGNGHYMGNVYVGCNDDSTGGTMLPHDVQVNGNSILSSGVANVPMASGSVLGVAKVSTAYGTNILPEGIIKIEQATSSQVKTGTQGYKPIVPERQHESVFYGLAKASGDTTQASSSNAVGTYTDAALNAIRKMLHIPNVDGELLYETTTTEDVADITVNVDSNGQAFKATKLIGIFNAGPSTTGTKDSFYGQIAYISNNNNNNSETTSFPSLTYPTATSNMCAKIEIEALSNMPLKTEVSVSTSEGSTTTKQSMAKPFIAKYFTVIRIYQSGATKSLIPAGSNFKLYGIRYLE